MTLAERKARLEALLQGFQDVWRPQPFRVETPAWCDAHPALRDELLALDDAAVDRLSADNHALIALIGRHLPALAGLAELIELPPPPTPAPPGHADRLDTAVPGRKLAQIDAYAAGLGPPRAPVLEWCAGKGHLGRLLAGRWHWPVASLEIDPALCDAGEDLARRAHVDCMQHFIRADALAPGSARHLAGRHAVALHACGDLHTRLVADAVAAGCPAIDVAPCCYYRTAGERYRPFNPTGLELGRDDLRLAVTETATASAAQRRQSRRALAWKLAWVELRRDRHGDPGYVPFPPVPERWLRGGFESFVAHMLERKAGRAPAPDAAGIDLAAYEARGWARAARMLRLQLARLAFRRPLEVWLLADMAVHLEGHGYAVTLGPFCPASLTPRNLLLSARKH
ncbi:methyltransferase [Parasulfuritortus cantonensis]|uniref:methyltransferase n=1 Tax=Parasulfuritortus cantonensis TaxID=2528202 RepID=UPI001404428B|nr:methyltransferase [Parasulfuritortus cantonensis]